MVSFEQYENLETAAERSCQLLGNALFPKLCQPCKEPESPRDFMHQDALSSLSVAVVELLLTCPVI